MKDGSYTVLHTKTGVQKGVPRFRTRLKKAKKETSVSAGNRTRVNWLATSYYTTKPPRLSNVLQLLPQGDTLLLGRRTGAIVGPDAAKYGIVSSIEEA